jgi:sialate O-acetylesterase
VPRLLKVACLVGAVFAGGALVWLALSRHAHGTLELAPLAADGMVLQRETTATIAGRALPGWPVVVYGSWGSLALTRADEGGAWRVGLRTTAAGGPYRVLVWAGDASVVRDVWIGETWLCSGQSNMAIAVGASNAAALLPSKDAAPIQLFTVGLAVADAPQQRCSGTWRRASAETVSEFSAVCWFFGASLHGLLGVPVGLVAAAASGIEIEGWTSERGLREVPEIAAAIDAARAWHASRRTDAPSIIEESALAPQPIAASNWRPLVELASNGTGERPLPTGVLSLRATLPMPADLVDEPLVLDLPPALSGATVRIDGYDLAPLGSESRVVPSQLLRNAEVDLEIQRSVDAGVHPLELVGARLRAGLRPLPPPVWEARVEDGERQRVRLGPPARERHSGFFNAMIAPLTAHTLKGIVWYQGEANVPRAEQYARTFPAMIRDWRAWWGSELPFGFVQLPGFGGYRPRGAISELRDAQRRTLAVPGTGMVVSIDLGDGTDIHGADKATIGVRLAAWALATVYGRSDIVASGPIFREMRIEPWGIRLLFDHATGGLVSSSHYLRGFEVAGADRVFHPAGAIIAKDTVIVRVPIGLQPVAVRYAWSDIPQASLKNRDGLPASPFRTDDWSGVTAGATWRAVPLRAGVSSSSRDARVAPDAATTHEPQAVAQPPGQP